MISRAPLSIAVSAIGELRQPQGIQRRREKTIYLPPVQTPATRGQDQLGMDNTLNKLTTLLKSTPYHFQYEDEIKPYMETCRLLYKELMT